MQIAQDRNYEIPSKRCGKSYLDINIKSMEEGRNPDI